MYIHQAISRLSGSIKPLMKALWRLSASVKPLTKALLERGLEPS
jgi:hypothetical protein